MVALPGSSPVYIWFLLRLNYSSGERNSPYHYLCRTESQYMIALLVRLTGESNFPIRYWKNIKTLCIFYTIFCMFYTILSVLHNIVHVLHNILHVLHKSIYVLHNILYVIHNIVYVLHNITCSSKSLYFSIFTCCLRTKLLPHTLLRIMVTEL